MAFIDMGMSISELQSVLAQIDEAYEHGVSDNRRIPCPVCNSELIYHKVIRGNSHRRAHCSNKECPVGFQE